MKKKDIIKELLVKLEAIPYHDLPYLFPRLGNKA